MDLGLLLLRISKLFATLSSLRLCRLLWCYRVVIGIEHKQMLVSINPDIIIDVGANNGQFGLAAFKWTSASIICIEPIPEAVNILKRVFDNEERVNIYECAVGSTNAKVPLLVAKSSDCSSLLYPTDLNTRSIPKSQTSEVRIVELVRLDEILSANDLDGVALLKIDVQGSELEVLKGMGDLVDFVDYIYCECSFVELYHEQVNINQIIEWAYMKGFRIDQLYNATRDLHGACIQCDLLFKRQQ